VILFHAMPLDDFCAFELLFSKIVGNYPNRTDFWVVATFDTKYGQIDVWLN
jgi:hypothetical protein